MIGLDSRPLGIHNGELKTAIHKAKYNRDNCKEINGQIGNLRAELPKNLGLEIITNNNKTLTYLEFLQDTEIEKNAAIDGKNYGNVAVINISGFISKQSYWDYWAGWVRGINETSKMLEMIGKDERLKAVMIKVDSGGGEIDGVQNLARIISQFKNKYKKPVWAFIDSVACSAAYWIISGADKIIMAEDTSRAGSIGVLIHLTDWQAYEKDIGIINRDVKASLSINKNKPYENALKGDDSLLIQELDNINNVFLKDIKNNRGFKAGLIDFDLSTATPENIPEVITGKVYNGQFAVTFGLADEVSKEGFDYEVFRLQKDRGSVTNQTENNFWQ
jgi:ClpP class serine protease